MWSDVVSLYGRKFVRLGSRLLILRMKAWARKSSIKKHFDNIIAWSMFLSIGLFAMSKVFSIGSLKHCRLFYVRQGVLQEEALLAVIFWADVAKTSRCKLCVCHMSCSLNELEWSIDIVLFYPYYWGYLNVEKVKRKGCLTIIKPRYFSFTSLCTQR